MAGSKGVVRRRALRLVQDSGKDGVIAIFPVLIFLAWLFVRRSNAFEDEAVAMVDESTLPARDESDEEPAVAPVPVH